MADFSMPVSLSMASFKMAMDIKPADISPKSSDVKPSASAPPAKQESFEDVFTRVEKDSDPAYRASKSEGKEKPSTSRKDEKTDSSTADQLAGEAQVMNHDKPVQEAKPGSSADTASENGKPVTSSVSQTAQEPSSPLQGETISRAIQDFIAGEFATMITVNGPAGHVTGTGTTNAGTPVDISAPVIPVTGNTEPTGPVETALPEKATGIPLPGENRVIFDIPLIRDTVTDIADNISSRLAEIPSVSSRQPLPSEWTETLEFKRLLDPTVDQDSARQPRMTEPPPVRLQATDSAIRREAAEVSRNPVPSRFDAEMSTAKNLDSKVLFAGVRPEVGILNPNIRDTGILFQASYRPPVNISPETSPVASAVADTTPAVQAKPTSLPAATPGSQQIDSEALVNDVRQVVMRIAADGTGQAKIVLHPPELGELVIRLQSARNGIVRVELQTISPLVRESLEAGLNKLTEALKSEGLTLAQAEVHLNLQQNAEGNSGQSGFPFEGQGTMNGSGIDMPVADTMQEPSIFVERLPDGATISILA